MYDWIIEADIYRLRKAARETSKPGEQQKLEALAAQKERILAARKSDPPATGGDEQGFLA